MQKLAVVILNYNGKIFLEQFLAQVIELSKPYEVIIADNASQDDSVAFLQQNFPKTQIIQLEENQGFAGGYNLALAQIKTEYYILLNSDVEVTQNWINPVLNFMEENSNVSACQPKVKSFHQKTHFEYAGAAGGFIDKYGYPFCRGRVFDTLEEDQKQYEDNKEIFWATGACMFVRAKVFKDLGGFDSDFFAHMEEIDLCWRMKNAGMQVFYISASTIFHVGGGTLQTTNPFKTYLNFRNNLALLYKNLPKRKVLSTLFIRFFLDNIAWLMFLVKGQFKQAFAINKAYFHFYKRLGLWRQKRRKLSNQKKLSQMYPKSIVFAYFAQKKQTWDKLNM